jgi:mannosyltransferase OCH1-like enzyme
MIPKIAYFYWNDNTPLSYFRYLTLVTFRKLHPDWDIKLYQSNANINTKWVGPEEQDFLQAKQEDDYITKCEDLNVKMYEYTNHNEKPPNFISDFFRWEMLNNTGGWFFDLDQIFLKSFDELCNYDFVIDGSDSCYVGVVGLSKNKISEFITSNIHKAYNPDHYCSIGPWYLLSLLKQPGDPILLNILKEYKNFMAPLETFYPVHSEDVHKLYFENLQISDKSYAIHWYGGHPKSQEYNKHATEKNFLKPTNTITTSVKKILSL